MEILAESFTENELELCKDKQCPEITINYVTVFGDEAIADLMNKKIRDFVIGSLMFEEDSSEIMESIDAAAANFARIYFEDKEKFPDMAADYSAEISVSEIYNSSALICFEMRQYLYTGGAHGYGATFFLNIDPNTGKELTLDELFRSKEKFTAFAENKFRKQQNIHKDQSISSQKAMRNFLVEEQNYIKSEI